MPPTLDEMPDSVAAEVEALKVAAASHLPGKRPKNLLVGTWNLRAFGNVTAKWNATSGDSPKRDWRAVALVGALVGHFDVVALQEVRRDTTALRLVLSMLGDKWQAVVSDVTEGDEGNDERLAFLYDSTRVRPSGLVGEIVLPSVAGNPSRQFARSPYAASFVRHDVEFILTTVHILWGKAAKDRIPELTAFAKWMFQWASRTSDWNENLLVLGDFNVDRNDSPLYKALSASGLFPPSQLNGIPRTIFDDEKSKHFYDQIAWFTDLANMNSLLTGMRYQGVAGSFDFLPFAFKNLPKDQVSWRISDHYPLWVEFQID